MAGYQLGSDGEAAGVLLALHPRLVDDFVQSSLARLHLLPGAYTGSLLSST